VDEPGSEAAQRLVAEAAALDRELVGPAFLPAEVLSVLRGKVARGDATPEERERAVTTFLGIAPRSVDDAAIYRHAWQIARDLAVPTVYDTVYLAVALAHNAPYWTADSAFYERAKGAYPAVRLLGSAD
jgi:predicted nucleic acid-binding protein